MSINSEFYEYASPIEYPLYVSREDSRCMYVRYDARYKITTALNAIKNKILTTMNELDLDSPRFEQLDEMYDTISIDIQKYNRDGVCDTSFAIDQNLELIEVMESDYVDIGDLDRYNIRFIVEYDYSGAKQAFLKDHTSWLNTIHRIFLFKMRFEFKIDKLFN